MVLNHIWGIYTHPKQEWETIDERHENLSYSLSHVLIIALIPALCAYYSGVHIGWGLGAGDRVVLSSGDGIIMASLMYLALVGGVMALAYIMHGLAPKFDSSPTFTQCLELSAYAATPTLMVGFSAFYPEMWFVTTVAMVGIAYSIYLLFAGVPILLHMPEDKGFIYSNAVVAAGLILLVTLMVFSVIVYSHVFA